LGIAEAVFLQAGYYSCHLTYSVKALKKPLYFMV